MDLSSCCPERLLNPQNILLNLIFQSSLYKDLFIFLSSSQQLMQSPYQSLPFAKQILRRENIIKSLREEVQNLPHNHPFPKPHSKYVYIQVFVEFGLENATTLGEGSRQKSGF